MSKILEDRIYSGVKMSIRDYFEQEYYNYLQAAGEKFAEKHSDRVNELNLSERQRKDDAVERLYEGFAFLMGRIHERLDDEIPEVTERLLEQLLGHLIRPFPSCSILQVTHNVNAITKPLQIKRHSEIQSPVGRHKIEFEAASGTRKNKKIIKRSESAEFIFRTSQEIKVRPMKIKAIRVETTPHATSALVIQIQPDRKISYKSLELDRLRFYLHGNDFLKYNLLLFLSNHVSSIAVAELALGKLEFKEIKPFKIGIPELSPELYSKLTEFSLIPENTGQSFSGFRLLQEYFAFPERFFFIDIEGLDKFEASEEGYSFEIKIVFDQHFPGGINPTIEDILLHCSPIVNLYDRPIEEVSVKERMPEYYILPKKGRSKSREIYQVNIISSFGEVQYSYIPATKYDVLDVHDQGYKNKRFYTIIRRSSDKDMAETYIRIFGKSMNEKDFSEDILRMDATLSNGFLPSQRLEANMITEPINFPPGIDRAFNLTKPIDVLPNPQHKNFQWDLISHLNLNLSTLANTETLKSILKLYNWSEHHDDLNDKKIEAITKVYPPETKNFFRNQQFIRGIEFKIEIDLHGFLNGIGDIHLLGLILSRFLSQYVTVNSSVILIIIEKGTNEEYIWKPIAGKILPV